jgi:hypothetical protein
LSESIAQKIKGLVEKAAEEARIGISSPASGSESPIPFKTTYPGRKEQTNSAVPSDDWLDRGNPAYRTRLN